MAPHADAGPGLVSVAGATNEGGLGRLAAAARRTCAGDPGVLVLILLLAAAGIAGLLVLHADELVLG